MLKAIINDFKEYKSRFKEFVFLRRFTFKLKFYSMLADMHHKASGLKTRVVIVGKDRKMEIWNKRTIEKNKKPIVIKYREILSDGSSKMVTKTEPGRIPKHWGSLEINHITFYLVGGGSVLTPEEKEAYRIKFNNYARRFL